MSGRRTARRIPARRRRRSRKPSGVDKALVVLFVGAAAVSLFFTAVQWLVAHWWVLLVVAAVALAAGAGWWQQHTQRRRWEAARARGLRYQLPQLDALHHFTRDAVDFSKGQRIHLIDRQMLGRWAAGSWPLWDLLPGIPAPRKPMSPS